MTDRIVLAYQKRMGNSMLTVVCNGEELGCILLDAPGTWLAVAPPGDAPPTFPSAENAVGWLLAQRDTATKEQP